MTTANFQSLSTYVEYSVEEMGQRATFFRKEMQRRRTVRHFSDRLVPRAIIEECLLAAGTAPNGANLQPWHFVVVSDPQVKHLIRVEAEEEEAEFYHRRAPQEWLDALAPLGTDEYKPFLDIAPYLIAVFGKNHSELPDGRRVKNYYVHESVGIATGILITALHNAGLVSLTHTPSPMGFLNTILERPADEKPFLLLVTGFPAEDAQVPVIQKKSLEEIATFVQDSTIGV
ncbi:MAG: nitroreductase family protein [Chloroflexota bacterium]|nr:nitroreductase family protein [Chloroflexota bacterium]